MGASGDQHSRPCFWAEPCESCRTPNTTLKVRHVTISLSHKYVIFLKFLEKISDIPSKLPFNVLMILMLWRLSMAVVPWRPWLPRQEFHPKPLPSDEPLKINKTERRVWATSLDPAICWQLVIWWWIWNIAECTILCYTRGYIIGYIRQMKNRLTHPFPYKFENLGLVG